MNRIFVWQKKGKKGGAGRPWLMRIEQPGIGALRMGLGL
jgi:hypothetical protein